jgi:hypothetical protein
MATLATTLRRCRVDRPPRCPSSSVVRILDVGQRRCFRPIGAPPPTPPTPSMMRTRPPDGAATSAMESVAGLACDFEDTAA